MQRYFTTQSILKMNRKHKESPAVTRTSLEKRLMDKIMNLEATVEKLNKKVATLEDTVEELLPLKEEIQKLNDINAVTSTVNKNLTKEVERLQQYSRRNCVILEGIPLKHSETISELEKVVKTTIKNEFKIEEKEITAEFDKTHRIGGVTRERKQRVIVRFKSHGFCQKIYSKRKDSQRIFVKPSLTKFRLDTLKKAKERFSNSNDVDFIYSDILGNLKIRLKNQLDGRFVHTFYDLDELSQILFDADYNSYES